MEVHKDKVEECQEKTSVFVWGLGANNSLGNRHSRSEIIPFIIKELQEHLSTKVVMGSFYTLVLTQTGELMGWGVNSKNRFREGPEHIQKPSRILLPHIRVKSVAAGNWHSVIVDTQGIAYGIGRNKYGQLGLGHCHSVTSYTQTKIDSCKDAACGDGFTLFVKENGSLYSVGIKGLHGHQLKDNLDSPKMLKIESIVVNVAAGFTHAACVTQDGEVYTWGQGQCFQLGHGNKNSQPTPKTVERLKGIKVVGVSCSRGEKHGHTMAVDHEGKVYTWGSGYKGKLGHEKDWTHEETADQAYPRHLEYLTKEEIKVKEVVAGGIHSCILTVDGDVYTWGCGSDGRLGHQQSSEHIYLYREGFPRRVESLRGYKVTSLCSSYYQNACIAVKRLE